MGPLGWQETLAIFVLALLIFGPKKLPELGKTIGKALTEFRRASSELKSTWDREMSNMERENESLKEITGSIQGELNDYSSSYSYEDALNEPASYDSTAANPSTVSASATEGAEPAAEAAQEAEVAAAEAAGENEGMAPAVVVADSPDAGAVPLPVQKADTGPAPESHLLAG